MLVGDPALPIRIEDNKLGTQFLVEYLNSKSYSKFLLSFILLKATTYWWI